MMEINFLVVAVETSGIFPLLKHIRTQANAKVKGELAKIDDLISRASQDDRSDDQKQHLEARPSAASTFIASMIEGDSIDDALHTLTASEEDVSAINETFPTYVIAREDSTVDQITQILAMCPSSKGGDNLRSAVPSSTPLSGVMRRYEVTSGFGQVICGKGPTVFASENCVTLGNSSSIIAWRLRVTGNTAFSIGALAKSQFEEAESVLYNSADADFILNNIETTGGNDLRQKLTGEEIICYLDGGNRSLTIASTSLTEKAAVLRIPDWRVGDIHLACMGFDDTRFEFLPIS